MSTTTKLSCPSRADGVHDLTKSMTCVCGYTMVVPRFGFSLDVHDNKTGTEVSEGFMSDRADVIADALERAADKLRRLR